MSAPIPTPPISEHEMTPLVKALIAKNEEYAGMILALKEQVQILKDEIAVLKGQKPRPKIPPNRLEKDKSASSDTGNGKDGEAKRPGSAKKDKTGALEVDETRRIHLENIPSGAKFKGWSDYVVQELTIDKKVILFQLACFVDADGKTIQAQLPSEYRTGHFGPQLIAFCLYQYHQCHVTQPLLLEAVREFGIDISAGQLNIILIENKEAYHAEKEAILEPALRGAGHFNTDDTGARHNGKNGYCTHIGGPLFSYFKSTESKSRINFLEVLRGRHTDYVVSDECLDYMFDHGASDNLLNLLEDASRKYFTNFTKWIKHLGRLGIVSEKEQRLATEGALIGSLFSHGFHDDLVIVSDDAPQFALSLNALCWIHAERHFRKFIPVSDQIRLELEQVRDAIWDLYRGLKAYKADPKENQKEVLSKEFDKVFTMRTSSAALNDLIDRTNANKDKLLRVLDYPHIPLHNNDSERDIREYVKRRKISGSTRSAAGRRARDTFTSLKKTCRKLKISFWQYLKDRIRGIGKIPSLAVIIKERSRRAAFS
jgi:Transposase IS66 family